MFNIEEKVEGIVQSYTGYIPAQFIDKDKTPKARATIEFIIRVAIASAIYEQLAICFSMEEASGKTLDMIAENFGLTRNLPIAYNNIPFFQEPEYRDVSYINAQDQYSTIDVVSLTNNGSSSITLKGIDGADLIPEDCFTVKDINNNEFCLATSVTIASGSTESLAVFRSKYIGAITVNPNDILTQVTIEEDLATPIIVNSQLTTGDDLGTTPDFVGYTDYSTTTNYNSVFRRYSSTDTMNVNPPDDVLRQVILFKVLASKCRGTIEDIISLLRDTGLSDYVVVYDNGDRTITYNVNVYDSLMASIIYALNLFPRPIGIGATLVQVVNPLGLFHFLEYGDTPLGFCFNAYGYAVNGRTWLQYP